MSRSILLCGGGSGGHVVPLLAVAQGLRARDPSLQLTFVCTQRPEEVRLLAHGGTVETVAAPGFKWNLSVVLFPVYFLAACIKARSILKRVRPSLVFSKGGPVSIPVCLMAWMYSIPIIHHESDSVPSRATRFIGRFACTLCTGFPVDTAVAFPSSVRVIHTGNPVRAEVLRGSRDSGCRITSFSGRRPVLMVIGGSQGALAFNQAVDRHFDRLIDLADIIHITGPGKQISRRHSRYFSRPFVMEELPHLYALSDVIVTRAGAGVLSELAALRKAAIVIPLAGVGHDHQVRNAEILERLGAVDLLPQNHIDELPQHIESLLKDVARRGELGPRLAAALPADASARIVGVILDALPAPG